MKKIHKKISVILASTVLFSFSDSCFAGTTYPIVAGLSGVKTKNRTLGELNLMMPIIEKKQGLTIFDIKLKQDNKKSIEGNLGIIYRHNINDKAVVGVYSYYDRRKTPSKLLTNQLTLGAEVFTSFADFRFNYYLPENKKKTIKDPSKNLIRNKTRVYVLSSGGKEERPLPGYDIEFGSPDNKFGTKIFVGKYDFSKKHFVKNAGYRFRLEQKFIDKLASKKGYELSIQFGSNYFSNRKHEYFAGISARWAIGEKSYECKSHFQKRMMDLSVRDIDIVTKSASSAEEILPLFWQGKEVHNIYFVGESKDENYTGDGSYESPFSKRQLEKLIKENKFTQKNTDLILPIILDKAMSEGQFEELLASCQAVDTRKHSQITLETDDSTGYTLEEMPKYFPKFDTKKIMDVRRITVEEAYSVLSDYPEIESEFDEWIQTLPSEDKTIANNAVVIALEELLTDSVDLFEVEAQIQEAHETPVSVVRSPFLMRTQRIFEERRSASRNVIQDATVDVIPENPPATVVNRIPSINVLNVRLTPPDVRARNILTRIREQGVRENQPNRQSTYVLPGPPRTPPDVRARNILARARAREQVPQVEMPRIDVLQGPPRTPPDVRARNILAARVVEQRRQNNVPQESPYRSGGERATTSNSATSREEIAIVSRRLF